MGIISVFGDVDKICHLWGENVPQPNRFQFSIGPIRHYKISNVLNLFVAVKRKWITISLLSGQDLTFRSRMYINNSLNLYFLSLQIEKYWIFSIGKFNRVFNSRCKIKFILVIPVTYIFTFLRSPPYHEDESSSRNHKYPEKNNNRKTLTSDSVRWDLGAPSSLIALRFF